MDNSSRVTDYINGSKDWRGDFLKDLREIINNAAPELTEDFKWGVPVWTGKGVVCAISAFKDHVKINFFKGAYLSDPEGLFNSGLDSKEHRSINLTKDDEINKPAIQELLKSAIAHNQKQPLG